MRRTIEILLWMTVCWAGESRVLAQTTAQAPTATTTKPAAEANPFPEDTKTVPVLPTKMTPTGEAANDVESGSKVLVGVDSDPVRSPEDAAGGNEDSSSSVTGLEKMAAPPEDEPADKKKHKGKCVAKEAPPHQESAAEDISVGSYYLDKKNWKAALSRFQSALVLDPENPDAYWGLAEAERHLGDWSSARGYYEKVYAYDPDSRHGKEAQKMLSDPARAAGK